jgi:hypothetical protein
MKALAGTTAAALAAALPLPVLLVPVLLILCGTAAVLVVLLAVGIALPAVWSSKPTRRSAAAAVLRQILSAVTSGRDHDRA